MAPPAIPMMSNADPCAVYLPKLFSANGQIAGHTIAFAKPNSAMKVTVFGKACTPSQPHNAFEIPVSVFELSSMQTVSTKPKAC